MAGVTVGGKRDVVIGVAELGFGRADVRVPAPPSLVAVTSPDPAA